MLIAVLVDQIEFIAEENSFYVSKTPEEVDQQRVEYITVDKKY